jgi:cell wall-associated NlpC family hydrolase
MTFDPRITPARDDLASTRLEGVKPAARYVEPSPMRCTVPAASLLAAPAVGAEQKDQLLFGEAFDVLETVEAYAWGQARRGGYVGYVATAALGPDTPPTHQVAAQRTYAVAEPDARSPVVLGPLSLNALVRVEREAGAFVRLAEGWVPAAHLAPVGDFAADYVAVAERFAGAAYVWGGRESTGVDCSGLVQQALFACGRACPRDTDLQLAYFHRAVARQALRRGDLVFWPGHVAIALDAANVLHATAHGMAVVREPLAAVISRRAAAGEGEPIGYRRP